MTAPSLLGVLHPVIITRDFAQARHFYENLLGLTPRPVTVHDPEKIRRLGGPEASAAQAMILHAPDGSELEIACFSRPGGAAETHAGWADAGIRSITFRVADMRAMLARLAEGGYGIVGEIVEFLVEERPVKVAYVNGPDGVILTLLQEGRF